MRLSSPRFAYLKLIYKILFCRIDLVASSENLELAVKTDSRRIAPFLKTVTFVAPTDNWALTLEGFREVCLAQAIQRYANDYDVHGGVTSNVQELDGHQKLIKQHWNGKRNTPLSKDQIRAGFEHYRGQALAAKDLLGSEQLRTTWIGVLQTLANVHNVCFATPEHDTSGGSDVLTYPHFAGNPYSYNGTNSEESCSTVIAPVGDALVAAGVACLAEANVEIHELEVACAMTGNIGWETLAGWKDLNLSQIWKFEIRPQVQSFKGNLDIPKGKESIAAWAAIALAAVMRKCGHKLEESSPDSNVSRGMTRRRSCRLTSIRIPES